SLKHLREVFRKNYPFLPAPVSELVAVAEHENDGNSGLFSMRPFVKSIIDTPPLSPHRLNAYVTELEKIGKTGIAHKTSGVPVAVAQGIANHLNMDVDVLFPRDGKTKKVKARTLADDLADPKNPVTLGGAGGKEGSATPLDRDALDEKYPLMHDDFI